MIRPNTVHLFSCRLLAAVMLVLMIVLPAASEAAQRRNRTEARSVPATNGPRPQVPGYSSVPAVQEFIARMVRDHGFIDTELTKMFGMVRRNDDVIRLISPATGPFKRSWNAYRARFLDPLRIREGTRFWRENQNIVRRASEQFGVPEEIIVSIIGVETIYGRITGDFRVIEALATLAFDYPRRGAYFLEELEQFLLLAREGNADVFSIRGSFAGAIGLPQFMPGSIRRFAVDFDNDGVIDLRGSAADAIGSVARFLAEHGWKPGEITHYPVAFEDENLVQPLIEAGIEPQFRMPVLEFYGIRSPANIPEETRLALIDLPNADDPVTYYLGAQNFYTITRYNRSSFYAMAVIELAQALKASR